VPLSIWSHCLSAHALMTSVYLSISHVLCLSANRAKCRVCAWIWRGAAVAQEARARARRGTMRSLLLCPLNHAPAPPLPLSLAQKYKAAGLSRRAQERATEGRGGNGGQGRQRKGGKAKGLHRGLGLLHTRPLAPS